MATRVARAKKPEVVVPLNGDVFPASDGPALHFVALDVIDAREQARTQFDDVALAELAADIRVRGILQPVLLRAPVDGRYVVIAGERRVRAGRMAGLSAVPALVGAVSDGAAVDMQLAENIQREGLSLQDEANAVRRLYDRLGKLDAVADRVKKSKSWVSKRLALTYDGFDWRAKKLLEDGITEDIELLQCVSKVGELQRRSGTDLDRDIRDGKAGRKEARALLAMLKKQADAAAVERAKDVAPVQRESVGDKSVSKAAPSEPGFDGRVVLWELVDELRGEECRSVADMVAGLGADQQVAVLDVCRSEYECGCAMVGCDAVSVVRRLSAMHAGEHLEDWSVASFTLGAFGMPFELGTLLAEVQLAVRG